MKNYVVCSLGKVFRVTSENVAITENGLTFYNWDAIDCVRVNRAHFSLFEYFYEVGTTKPGTFWENLFSPSVKITKL